MLGFAVVTVPPKVAPQMIIVSFECTRPFRVSRELNWIVGQVGAAGRPSHACFTQVL